MAQEEGDSHVKKLTDHQKEVYRNATKIVCWYCSRDIAVTFTSPSECYHEFDGRKVLCHASEIHRFLQGFIDIPKGKEPMSTPTPIMSRERFAELIEKYVVHSSKLLSLQDTHELYSLYDAIKRIDDDATALGVAIDEVERRSPGTSYFAEDIVRLAKQYAKDPIVKIYSSKDLINVLQDLQEENEVHPETIARMSATFGFLQGVIHNVIECAAPARKALEKIKQHDSDETREDAERASYYSMQRIIKVIDDAREKAKIDEGGA